MNSAKNSGLSCITNEYRFHAPSAQKYKEKEVSWVGKNPSLLPETWKKRNGFFFPGDETIAAQQNRPNYDYKQKKTDVPNVPHIWKGTPSRSSRQRSKVEQPPTSCGNKKLPGKTVAILTIHICKSICNYTNKNYFHSIQRGDFHLYPLKVLFNETLGINLWLWFSSHLWNFVFTNWLPARHVHILTTTTGCVVVSAAGNIPVMKGNLTNMTKPRSTVSNTWNFSSSSIV